MEAMRPSIVIPVGGTNATTTAVPSARLPTGCSATLFETAEGRPTGARPIKVCRGRERGTARGRGGGSGGDRERHRQGCRRVHHPAMTHSKKIRKWTQADCDLAEREMASVIVEQQKVMKNI